jgi:tetratricopeptide (TPR) repeat protein
MNRALLLLSMAFALQGCIQTIAVRTMGGILDNGFQAFNEESDLQLAHEALASNLKLIEALIKSDPENEKFLMFAAQGYNAYALAFAEDDSVERARVFYLRAKDYGMRILMQNSAFKEAFDKDDATFAAAIQKMDKENVPAMFWTAFSWGSYINITRTDITALADLAKVQAMIRFVAEKDSSYYYGGAYMFLGAIEGTTPPGLGGKPEKAKEYFEKALAINKGKFLMTQLYYAKTYAVQVLDQELFEKLLQEVEAADLEALPEVRLPNAVAKQKARRLLSQAGEIF